MKRTLILLMLAAFAAAALSACHTVHGFGQDMSALGHKIEGKDDGKKDDGKK